MSEKYIVWECKIVVPENSILPEGFDSVPRRSAIEAVESAGLEVVSCFSGWGGTLSEIEKEIIKKKTK